MLLQIKQRVSEKLGVCPFCMRASALGSLASWAIYAGARLIHLDRMPAGPLLLALLAIVASCFTLLISAHLVAYMVRAARDIREFERRPTAQEVASPATTFPRSTLSRREFIRVVLGAGAYAAMIALLGTVPSFGQPMCTDGVQPAPSDTILGRGDDDDEALEQMIDNANAFCEDWCNAKGCGGLKCMHSGKPVITAPKCKTLSNGQRSCVTTVKGGCNCGCKACQGRHIPTNSIWGKEHIAEGAGVSAGAAQGMMEADAKTKCDNFCGKFSDCPAAPPPPKMCRRETDPQLGDRKTWEVPGDPNPFRVKARIKACQCKCL